MGIFGFLSKAHLDQTIQIEGSNGILISNLERQISQQRRIITDGETLLKQLDDTVEVLIEYDRIRGPEGALAVRKGQAEQRAEINSSIQSAVSELNALSEELLPLQKERVALEAEVGPLKYIAELIYADEAEDMLDEAVRGVIIIIIFVFDPLAVLLLIAANQSLAQERPTKVRKEVLDAYEKVNEEHKEVLEKLEDNKDESSYLDRHNKRPKDWQVNKNKSKLVVDKNNITKL